MKNGISSLKTVSKFAIANDWNHRYLPAIGRFLIVVTFLEDAIRIITQWNDQLLYLHDYRHSELPTLLIFPHSNSRSAKGYYPYLPPRQCRRYDCLLYPCHRTQILRICSC